MKKTFTLLAVLFVFQMNSQTVTTVAGNGISGANNGTITTATFNGPNGVAVDSKGFIYVADANNNMIRRIDLTSGTVTTLPGNYNVPVNLCTDNNRSVYAACFSGGDIRKVDTLGNPSIMPGSYVNPDAVAYFNNTWYVTEWNGHKVKTINNGTVATLAGGSPGYLDGNISVALFNGPYGITTDNVGNIIVSDRNNNKIRKIDTFGNVTTVAGSTGGFQDGPANTAKFNAPTGVAVDASNNIYVADFNNHKIRKIDPLGNVTTVAGSNAGFADGIGGAAMFNFPAAIALDKTQSALYVADFSNNRVRKIKLFCNAADTPTLSASSVSLCIGNTTTLNITGALNAATSWSIYAAGCGSGSVAATSSSSIVLSPTITTTYYVRGEGGCAATSTVCTSITVTVSPFTTPTLVVSGTNSLCMGASITQTVNGANTYTWSTGANTSVIFLTPTITTVYNVSGTDGNGCSNSTSKTITVNAVPNVSISGSGAICIGSSLNLNGSGASTYTWSTGANTASISLTPTVTATYTLNGTSAAGCSNSATKTVTVNPTPTITITGNNSVCVGSSVMQTASGANAYNWNTGANTATVLLTPSVTTSYTVFGTDANGCTNATTKTILVNPLPIITITGSSSTLCPGATITQTANGANSYTWSTGANTGFVFLSPTVTTTYSVSGTDGNGCINSATKTLTVSPPPTLITGTSNSLMCTGTTATLYVSGANTYSWSTGANTSSIAVTLTTTTTFTVDGTDVNGCSNSTSITQIVSACAGINGLTLSSSDIRVFPNPNNGMFNVEVPDLMNDCNITLVNTLGQIVYSQNIVSGNNKINCRLAPGLYYYVLNHNNTLLNKGKLIIE